MIFASWVEPLIDIFDIFILINGRAIKLKWHFANTKEAWKVLSLEKYVC